MDLSAFGEPWEQIRLLSDPARNRVIRTLLERRAKGARVLEVGCGHGVWACVAARLGATQVVALEPTVMAELARELVRANGLQDRVTVQQCLVQDLEPMPSDLVFSELLNADPFQEDVVGAMSAATRWLAPGGTFAPYHLRVWVALARDLSSVKEYNQAWKELDTLGQAFGLNLQPAQEHMGLPGPYRAISTRIELASPPALLFDLDLLSRPRVPHQKTVTLVPNEPGPVSAAVAWFEAVYDEDLILSNTPGAAGHWGNLVCSWPEERAVKAGEYVKVRARLHDDGLVLYPD